MDNPPFIDDLLYPLRPSFTGHVQSPRLVVPRYCRYVVGWLSLSKPLVSGVWPKQDLNDLNVATLYFLISSSSGPDLQESKNHKNPDLVFSFFFKHVYWILYWYSIFNQVWDDPQSPMGGSSAPVGHHPKRIKGCHFWITATSHLQMALDFSYFRGAISKYSSARLLDQYLEINYIILYYIHLFLIHISGM